MADPDPSGTNIDPLIKAYESRLQSLVMWDFESLPSLKSYLGEGKIVLNVDDPRFAELLRADIRFRVQRSRPADDEAVLATLIQQFPEMPHALISELALYEWQLWHEAGLEPDVQLFVQNLKIQDDASRKELAELLAQSPVASASRQASVNQLYAGALRSGDIVGPYTITEMIGHGGMGEVYKAQRLSPFRMDVALKVVLSGNPTRTILNRFDAERQALAIMEHPNIAKVFDAGVTSQGLPYFAMEVVDGIPLTKFCDRNRLSLTDRLALFIQICRAIQHAHQKGIIHRDIKPGNVLVAMTDAGPSVKVIDFGLARAVQPELRLAEESRLTLPTQFVGTLRYMSPEQTRGTNPGTDVRSDVYSLGVVLYELLTGSTPLDEFSLKQPSLEAILSAIRNDDPPRPSARLNSTQSSASTISELRKTDTGRLTSILKGDLDWIVMKALEKEPNRRYESASRLAEDVERFLTGQPVVARPPSLTYRIGKTLRRNRVASIVSVILAGASFAVLTATWTAISNAFEADQERIQKLEADTKAANAVLKATMAESQTQIALQQKQTIEREKILQSLLTNPDGPKSSEAQLTALNEAMSMELMDDINRVDLQLAKLDVLHRMQRFAELRPLISEIEPLTLRQEGQLDLWKIRKSVSFPEQIELAQALLNRKDEVELREAESRYLACLMSPSRSEAIILLEALLMDFPQHEPSRKLLVTLLLLEGRSIELDEQVEKSRLLFPGSLDVELTACVAFALRGEQQLAEAQLQRLKALGLVSVEEELTYRGLTEFLLFLAETLATTGAQSESGAELDPAQLLMKMAAYFASFPQTAAVMEETFGTALDIGRPTNTNTGLGENFLLGLTAKIAMASAKQFTGNHTAMIGLITDFEKLSPIPGDALFLRTRSIIRLQPNNFAAALEELDPAVSAPCVFPKLRQQILYEAAMCHLGVYSQNNDDNHLKTAGQLALQWMTISDSLPEFQVANLVKILGKNGHYDDALHLLLRFRTRSPNAKNSLIVQELQVLKAARRYPELLEVADQALIAREDKETQEVAAIISIRDEALLEMSTLLDSQRKVDGN
jgi:serine/threonine protein kinase